MMRDELENAIINGDKDAVQKILLTHPEFVKGGSEQRKSPPIVHAATHGQFDIFKLLLNCGADINEANVIGNTALFQACSFGHLTIVSYLCDKDLADFSLFNKLGRTAAHQAAANGEKDILEYLLARGFNVDHRDEYDNTLLMIAAAAGQPNVAFFLISNNADLSAKNKAGETALDRANENLKFSMIELLEAATKESVTLKQREQAKQQTASQPSVVDDDWLSDILPKTSGKKSKKKATQKAAKAKASVKPTPQKKKKSRASSATSATDVNVEHSTKPPKDTEDKNQSPDVSDTEDDSVSAPNEIKDDMRAKPVTSEEDGQLQQAAQPSTQVVIADATCQTVKSKKVDPPTADICDTKKTKKRKKRKKNKNNACETDAALHTDEIVPRPADIKDDEDKSKDHSIPPFTQVNKGETSSTTKAHQDQNDIVLGPQQNSSLAKKTGSMKNLVNGVISTDTTWYTDDEMSKLLHHHLRHNEEVEFLDGLLGTDWRGNHLKDNLEQFNIRRLEAIARSEKIKDKVLVPVNLNNNHWILVYFIYQKDASGLPDVYYFDPLGQRVNKRVEAEIMAQKFFPAKEIINMSERVQRDGYNCGPWVIEAARSIVASGALPGKNFDINLARKAHRNILTHQDDPLKSSQSKKTKPKAKLLDNTVIQTQDSRENNADLAARQPRPDDGSSSHTIDYCEPITDSTAGTLVKKAHSKKCVQSVVSTSWHDVIKAPVTKTVIAPSQALETSDQGVPAYDALFVKSTKYIKSTCQVFNINLTEKIPQQVLSIMTTLRRNGYIAYLIGGCVRDLLLGKPPNDFDLITNCPAVNLANIYPQCRSSKHIYALFTILISNVSIDINVDTSFEMLKDANKRDLTANAIYLDEYGNFYDPTESGLQDVCTKKVRVIGNSLTRLIEDPIRMLRVIRLCVDHSFELDQGISLFIHINASTLSKCAQGRTRYELIKHFKRGNSQRNLDLLLSLGLLEAILPELAQMLNQSLYFFNWFTAKLKTTDKLHNLQAPISNKFIAALMVIGKVLYSFEKTFTSTPSDYTNLGESIRNLFKYYFNDANPHDKLQLPSQDLAVELISEFTTHHTYHCKCTTSDCCNGSSAEESQCQCAYHVENTDNIVLNDETTLLQKDLLKRSGMPCLPKLPEGALSPPPANGSLFLQSEPFVADVQHRKRFVPNVVKIDCCHFKKLLAPPL